MVNPEDSSNCGIGGCHPGFLRPLATIQSFICGFAALGFWSWSMYTVTVAQISTIEKAFGLSSSETGWMLTVWEIGYITFTTIASYYSPRAHIPRIIGIATLVCGFSGIVGALPHFTSFESVDFSVLEQNKTSFTVDRDSKVLASLCLNNVTKQSISAVSAATSSLAIIKTGVSKKTVAYALFCLSMFMQGVGKAPCFPYSSQYIDDNVDKQKTGFYVGIWSSIAMFGLTAGYGIGSAVLQLHVTLKETSLLSTDVRYIGAWWLGILIVGLTTMLVALPMFCFPRRLKARNNSALTDKKVTKTSKRGMTLVLHEMKAWLSTCLNIYRKPLFLFSLLASCFQINGFASFFGFEPKYIESQFSVPSWKANTIIGVASIVPSAIGTLVIGYVTKRIKMTPVMTFRLIIGMNLLSVTATTISMFLGCQHQDVIKPIYNTSSTNGPFFSSLVPDCDCTGTKFLPICGDTDQQIYFSPCHAGCTNGTAKTYSSCSGIPGGTATLGVCATGCTMLWPYTVLKFLTNMFEAMVGIPFFLVFLRSVGEERKALALGLSATTTSILAWTPGPVVGGSVIDSTCLVWSTSATSGLYCAYYNIQQLRYRMHGLQIGFRVAATLVVLLLYIFKARKIPAWPFGEDKPTSTGEANMEMEENFKDTK